MIIAGLLLQAELDVLVGGFLEQVREEHRGQIALAEGGDNHRDDLTQSTLTTDKAKIESMNVFTFPSFSGLLATSIAAFTAAPDEIPQNTPFEGNKKRTVRSANPIKNRRVSKPLWLRAVWQKWWRPPKTPGSPRPASLRIVDKDIEGYSRSSWKSTLIAVSRHEAGSYALDLVRTGLAAAQHWRLGWLNSDGLEARF